MAPTPNQYLIQQNPETLQAPQVQEQVIQNKPVEEGQVSMPSPSQWVGPINYGIDWYKLGSQGFEAAKSIYEDTLKYSINKKTAQLRDLQYDFQTNMLNTFSQTVDPNPQKYQEISEEPIDFSLPFQKSIVLQQNFKKAANEIIGFKDQDGNEVDVFDESFNFDGYGSAWFNVVETARSGLMDVSRDAERVQSDLLKSFREKFDNQNIHETWLRNGYISNSDNEKIGPLQRPYKNGISPVNQFIEEFGPENIKFETKTINGTPILTVDPSKNVFINPKATDEDLLRTFGVGGFSALAELDEMESMRSQGINLPHKLPEDFRQYLTTENLSPSQAIRFKAMLKFMSPEKLNHALSAGTDFDNLQKAKLWVAYSISGAYPGMEEVTPETFIKKVNSIKTPQANTLSSLYNSFTKSDNRTEIPQLRQNTKNYLKVLTGAIDENGKVIDEELSTNIDNELWFNNYIISNPNVQPLIFGAVLQQETLMLNGIPQEEAAKLTAQSLNSVMFKDSKGYPILSRNPLYSQLGKKSKDTTQESTGWYGIAKNIVLMKEKTTSQPVDSKIKEMIETSTPEELTFKVVALNQNINEQDFTSIIESTDSLMIPTNSPLTVEDRLNLIKTIRTVTNGKGQNISSTPSLGEILRITIATNPSVIKVNNNNIVPTTKEESLRISSEIYNKIGPPELWGWQFKNSSSDDQLLNSRDGGIPFNASFIPFINNEGKTENLLDNRLIVSSVNKENFRVVDASNGIPYTMLPSSSLTMEGKDAFVSYLEKLLQGKRPQHIELDLGRTPLTQKDDSGLASAAQLLARAQDGKSNLSAYFLSDLPEETRDMLLDRITINEAKIAAKEPEFINWVSNLLTEQYGKQNKSTWVSSIASVIDNEDIFDFIVSIDSDNDGKLTKLDLITNIHTAAVGYKLNMTFNEGTQDIYPKPQETLFWDSALSQELNYDVNLKNSYTQTILKTEEKQNWINNELKRYYEAGIEEVYPLVSQVAGGGGELLKATAQSIFPIDLIMDTEYESVWTQAAKTLFSPGATKVNFDLSTGMMSKEEAELYKQGLEEVNRQNKEMQDKEKNKSAVEKLNENRQTSPGAVSNKPYIKLISEFEGLKTEAYWDDTGKVWTIGKGTTKYPDGTPVKKGDKISKQQAEDFAQNYVDTKVIPTLEKTIPTWNKMNPNQQAALVSFAYNLGENFYGRKGFETLTKALSNVDTFDKVPDALKLYNKSGGKKLDGLVRRRKAEADLWLSN
jgi:GH24 family phage-related lysozyme (muramidase)